MNNEEIIRKTEAEMIEQCLEYTKSLVDNIYIYGCCEGRVISANCFFQKKDEVYSLNKLNIIDPDIDVSRKSMSDLLHTLVKIIINMKEFCELNNVKMPKELKIIYNVREKESKINMEFENQFDYENFIGCSEIFDKWFYKIKAEVEE